MSTSSDVVVFIHRPSILCVMKILQAFKFVLKTSIAQEAKLRKFVGDVRYVWNKALTLQQEMYSQGKKKLNYADLCKKLTEWRHTDDTKWLAQSHSQVLQQTLKDLERAYKNFFEKRAAFPQFKKLGQHDSIRYPQGFKIDANNSRVYLPKLGWIKYRKSREIKGLPKNITVTRSTGRWYISIQTEDEIDKPQHSSTSMVGIDLGVARFATLSDGTVFEPINSFKHHQHQLARYQRAMSHKVKFSSNWKKCKGKVQRLHTRIANIRRDYLHKTTTTISKNHAMICIEDLQVRNMTKTATGTVANPGKNVSAKSGLNRVILDQGWSEFRRQLLYKQAWRGGDVLLVSPKNTSRTCLRCHYVSKQNRKTQSQFLCVNCSYSENADLVGAINVLRAGHAQLACGELALLGHSVKQELTNLAGKTA